MECVCSVWIYVIEKYLNPVLSKEQVLNLVAENSVEQIKDLSVLELKEVIFDNLKLDKLIKDSPDNNVFWEIQSEEKQADYIEQQVKIIDLYAGTFTVSCFLPNKQKASYPVIIGFHGHGPEGAEFMKTRFLISLINAGFAVVIPELRCMDANEREQQVSIDFMRNDFSLMSFRVYEAIKVVEYIKNNDSLDALRMGIIGHSGGSAICRLLVWLENGFKAIVNDYKSTYLEFTVHGRIHCETIPCLYPYQESINKVLIPYLSIKYGYEDKDDIRKIVDFFKENL